MRISMLIVVWLCVRHLCPRVHDWQHEHQKQGDVCRDEREHDDAIQNARERFPRL